MTLSKRKTNTHNFENDEVTTIVSVGRRLACLQLKGNKKILSTSNFFFGRVLSFFLFWCQKICILFLEKKTTYGTCAV